jgi:hypothetical protein
LAFNVAAQGYYFDLDYVNKIADDSLNFVQGSFSVVDEYFNKDSDNSNKFIIFDNGSLQQVKFNPLMRRAH